MTKKVFISGCFDLFHSGHIAFFQEAARYGDLYVAVGSDKTIYELKSRAPVNTELERLFMIQSVGCVRKAFISQGSGILDFEGEITEMRPDIFIVNEDGNTPEKQKLCERLGIEYKVLRREPHKGLLARSAEGYRSIYSMPYRIDLAGGWLDQPFVSSYYPGPVLTISLEPTIEFNERSEMAYPEDRTPYLLKPLVTSQNDFNHLKKPDFAPRGRLQDRVNATRAMVKAAGDDCLVLGWVDMPFAEACSLCGVSEFMLMLIEQPELAHNLLEFLTEVVIDFALAQVETGAPMIGGGDAAASLISPRFFRQFALPYEQQVCRAVHAAGGLVKLHICGKTTHILADMVRSGADLFNVDHLVDLAAARKVYEGAGKCFKGNLNPVGDMLQVSAEQCSKAALRCLQIAQGSRYMLSAGCEVPAEVTDEVFRAFCHAPLQI
jgi:MtaA/CmuA family methyltransferase